MKLRRAMITAAATAVISPLALLSAPVAFATDEQPSTSTSSPSTDGSDSSPEETAPGNTEESSPAADETVTDGEEGDPVTDESSPAASPSESETRARKLPRTTPSCASTRTATRSSS